MKEPDRSRHYCVVGIQWGDEGKGKIVDALTPEFDVVVRYQGGANAGHTVRIGEREFVFHLLPSGILQEGKTCIIGNGVALDPRVLIEELDQLRAQGIDGEKSLWISERAHVVLPYHRLLDIAREESLIGRKIGTTLRGIGPCYTDKTARQGIRMIDLIHAKRFRAVLERNLEQKNAELVKIYHKDPVDFRATYDEYVRYAERLAPRVCDISKVLWREDGSGKRIIFEGAQGFLLDLDLGTYPYVTSSNTSFLGLGSGTGFSPRRVGTVLGVAKAYSTRVGEGPFPTELADVTGDLLRRVGNEYGATTGRPRRCGWLDMEALRYAICSGDVDALAITKLDVLDGLDEIRVSTHYLDNGQPAGGFPTCWEERFQPVYKSMPGWRASTSACTSFADLPPQTRDYLQFIANESARPIAMLSVGKDRRSTIHLDPWLEPEAGRGGRCG